MGHSSQRVTKPVVEGQGYRPRILFACMCALLVLTLPAMAQQGFRAKDVVVKIRKVKLSTELSLQRGTGWCLDPKCGFVVTNYHVAAYSGSSLKIKGAHVREVSFATGPQDPGAVRVRTAFGVLKFLSVHDLALLRLNRPLARKGMHGPKIYGDRIRENEPVNLYTATGFWGLKTFSGRFVREAGDGILEFRFDGPAKLRRGMSGSLIVNRENQAVAVLCGMADSHEGVGVPIWSLADFIKKINPELAAEILPKQIYRPLPLWVITEGPDISPSLPDDRPRKPDPVLPGAFLHFELTASPPQISVPGTLQHRTEDSIEVRTLRANAQRMTDGMRTFIAVATSRLGVGQSMKTNWVHEVRVVDGHQIFEALAPGAPEGSSALFSPHQGVGISEEWYELPKAVGTNEGLRVAQDLDRVIDGHNLKVFHYEASVEDGTCTLAIREDYLFFYRDHSHLVACNGYVWTDQDFHIVRMTQHLILTPILAKTPVKTMDSVVIYGWIDGVLLPWSIREESLFNNGKTYWSETTFSEYQKFQSSVKLLSSEPVGGH